MHMGTIQRTTHEHNAKSVWAVLQLMPVCMTLIPCVHNDLSELGITELPV